MKIDEALKIAFEELDDVQFVDNTAKEASEAKAEVRYILRGLAVRLTKYAPDVASAASAEPDSGLESVPAVESDTQPRG